MEFQRRHKTQPHSFAAQGCDYSCRGPSSSVCRCAHVTTVCLRWDWRRAVTSSTSIKILRLLLVGRVQKASRICGFARSVVYRCCHGDLQVQALVGDSLCHNRGVCPARTEAYHMSIELMWKLRLLEFCLRLWSALVRIPLMKKVPLGLG